MTNTIDAKHADIKETNGTMNNGGVSIYYSFRLELLFWSYQNGRTFMSALRDQTFVFDKIFHLATAHKPNQQPQALCSWTEIATHPGLVLAMTLITNNPVAIMLMPERIVYQEIKLTSASSKSKIQDMVVTRHPSKTSFSGANSPTRCSQSLQILRQYRGQRREDNDDHFVR